MYAKKHKYKYVIFMHWKFKKSSLEKQFEDSIVFLNPSLIDKAYGFFLMKLYKEKDKNISNLIKARVDVQTFNERKIRILRERLLYRIKI